MKPWLLNPYELFAEARSELEQLLISAFYTDNEGKLVETSNTHSITYTTPRSETGNILTDADGNEYPEVVAAAGFYAEVLVRDPVPVLNNLAIKPNKSVAEYYEKLAQKLLSELESGNVIIDGVEYQVRTQDIDRINQKIGWMQRNAIESVEWIVADNTTKTCTVEGLYKILDAQQARQDSAIQQYTEWRLGDKQTPFEPTI